MDRRYLSSPVLWLLPLAVWAVWNRGIDEGWWGSETSDPLIWCASAVSREDCSAARTIFSMNPSIQIVGAGSRGFRGVGEIYADNLVYRLTDLPTHPGVLRLISVDRK